MNKQNHPLLSQKNPAKATIDSTTGGSRRSSISADTIDSALDGHFENEDLYNSRRNSLLSISSTNTTLDNSIWSRRLSLIAAQALSSETRDIARRASICAAAGLVDSLTDTSAYPRASILGGGRIGIEESRRQSLLVVSNLMSSIEHLNGQQNLSSSTALGNRRGSDGSVSIGSIFSYGEPDMSTLHSVRRRSSLDSLNNINTIYPELVKINKTGNEEDPTTPDQQQKNEDVDSNNSIDSDSIKSLYVSMEKSRLSQTAIHNWDRKMGLRRSHSQTMRNSSRSRKKLIHVMTKGKNPP